MLHLRLGGNCLPAPPDVMPCSSAGFVGFHEFDLYRSAAMMALETFGGMVLVILALPQALQLVCPRQASGSSPGWSSVMLQNALLGFAGVRAASACAAMLSAAIQKRHLYVWALFAPRFVFEACFLLVSDVVLVLLAGWSGAATRVCRVPAPASL